MMHAATHQVESAPVTQLLNYCAAKNLICELTISTTPTLILPRRGGPPSKPAYHVQDMASDQAQTKAIRRRTLRETFPPPLNQIALRHVDAVAALDDDRRLILSQATQKTDLRHAATFIDVFNKGVVLIQNADDLIALIPSPSAKEAEKSVSESNPADVTYLANLLLKCYPDMPRTSADALAKARAMEGPLQVVRATRNALNKAGSDFAVITLLTLFEEKSNELKDLINKNPAFVKAIQLSRPNWQSGY